MFDQYNAALLSRNINFLQKFLQEYINMVMIQYHGVADNITVPWKSTFNSK